MCMYDDDPEARRLRKRAVTLSAGSGCLAGLPALNGNGFLHQHQWMVLGVIGLQVCMIAKALHLMSQRKRLLQGSSVGGVPVRHAAPHASR